MKSIVRTAVLLVGIAFTSGCTLRYAHNSFDDARLNDNTSGPGVEMGMTFRSYDALGGQADVMLMGTFQRFDFFTDAMLSQVNARGRLLPWPTARVRPFVGLGLGFHRLWRTEDHNNCRGSSICLGPGLAQHLSPAGGANPHFVVGAETPLFNERTALVLDVTREFLSDPSDWNLNFWRISAGLSYRPR